MNQNTIQEFRNVLKRIYLQENRERYTSLYAPERNGDEERIWKLCEEFWPPEYSKRTPNIEAYAPNSNLDDVIARRYIKELTELLDKLGWASL